MMNFSKRTLLLLLFPLLFTVATWGQPYLSMLDSSATWDSQLYDQYGPTFIRNRYALNNADTLIGGNSYKTIYQGIGAAGPYKGALREDSTGRVFFIPKDSVNEQLLYDFSVQVGDSLHNLYSEWLPDPSVEVINVDSVQIGGVYRKTVEVSYNISWVEGIGSMNGIFDSPYGGSVSGVFQLECFSHSGQQIFPNYGGAACGMVGVPEPGSKGSVIFPNPFTTTFEIRSPEMVKRAEIRDLNGRIIAEKVFNLRDNAKWTPEMSGGGLYFLIWEDEKGDRASQKILRIGE